MEDKIERYFKEIKGIYSGVLKKKERKWFNGGAFYPLYNYSIRNEKLFFDYSFQSNEYSFSNALLSSKVDIHKIQMSYSFLSQLSEEFTISAGYNLITLLLKGYNGYKVMSNDLLLKNYLSKDQFVSNIFTDFLDPEFSPIIIGSKHDNKYVIQIHFNLVRFNSDIFSLIDKFIINFENKYIDKKKD